MFEQIPAQLPEPELHVYVQGAGAFVFGLENQSRVSYELTDYVLNGAGGQVLLRNCIASRVLFTRVGTVRAAYGIFETRFFKPFVYV